MQSEICFEVYLAKMGISWNHRMGTYCSVRVLPGNDNENKITLNEEVKEGMFADLSKLKSWINSGPDFLHQTPCLRSRSTWRLTLLRVINPPLG